METERSCVDTEEAIWRHRGSHGDREEGTMWRQRKEATWQQKKRGLLRDRQRRRGGHVETEEMEASPRQGKLRGDRSRAEQSLSQQKALGSLATSDLEEEWKGAFLVLEEGRHPDFSYEVPRAVCRTFLSHLLDLS